MLVFKGRRKPRTRRKTSQSKGDNQQQTQPTHGNRATLVEGTALPLLPKLSMSNISNKQLHIILTMYFQTYFLTPWILPEDNTKVSIISDGSRRKEVKPRTFKSKSFCCHDNVQQIAINDH